MGKHGEQGLPPRDDPEYMRLYAAMNRGRINANRVTKGHNKRGAYLRKYGLSVDDVEQMRLDQHNRCAICQGPPTKRGLFVDHNHATGKVRGLLCAHCNYAIGHLRDDPQRARALAEYLERTDGQ